jgi:organic hydroperoxide reductase OsmC/OhrA
MSEHRATVSWSHSSGDFLRGTYSREHIWTFDGGQVVPASPSPSVVATPYANPAFVDPEEAFVAAIASCHLLTFLHEARKRGLAVASYADEAVGRMTKNDRGIPWVSAVILRPRISWVGAPPAPDVVADLHHLAHEHCFIANSVRTDISVEDAQPS